MICRMQSNLRGTSCIGRNALLQLPDGQPEGLSLERGYRKVERRPVGRRIRLETRGVGLLGHLLKTLVLAAFCGMPKHTGEPDIEI
jgi:hypothetical protein